MQSVPSETDARSSDVPKERRMLRQDKKIRMRDQSTLTQLDFVQASHSINPATLTDQSDIEEYGEPPPKKRRKFSTTKRKRDPGQSTLTQQWDWRTIREVPDSDEDDESSEDMEKGACAPPFSGKVAAVNSSGVDGDSRASARHLLYIHRNGGRQWKPRSCLSNLKRPRFASLHNPNMETSIPRNASFDRQPETPRKHAEQVIPTSQTSTSTCSSPLSARKDGLDERSLLEERSPNIDFSGRRRARPDRRNSANELNDDVESQIVDERDANEPRETWTAALSITPKRNRRTKKMNLERTRTIQDSEDESEFYISPMKPDWRSTASHAPGQLQSVQESEDMNQEQVSKGQADGEYVTKPPCPDIPGAAKSKRVETMRDSEESTSATSNLSPRKLKQAMSLTTRSQFKPRRLRRIETVLESEQDDLDFNNPDYFEEQPRQKGEYAAMKPDQSPSVRGKDNTESWQSNDHATEQDTYLADDESFEQDEHTDFLSLQPQTYDPVAAALERDAARFGKTDTQLIAEERHSHHETSDAEPDQCEIDVVPTSQPSEKSLKSFANARGTFHNSRLISSPNKADHADIDDSGYGSQLASTAMEEGVQTIPSSQPGERRRDLFIPPPTLPTPKTSNNPIRHGVNGGDSTSRILPVRKKKSRRSQQRRGSSSPATPPRRPSQISTVYNSQQSDNSSSLGNSSPPHSSPHSTTHELQEQKSPSALYSSPRQGFRSTGWNEPLSSSPFPLPPGYAVAANVQSNYDTMARTTTQGSTLLDFSLPPPPPPLLFSSSSIASEARLAGDGNSKDRAGKRGEEQI